MIADLSGLRMALDEYDHAVGHHSQREAEKRVRRIATIGLLRTLIAALEDADRERWPDEPPTTPPEP